METLVLVVGLITLIISLTVLCLVILILYKNNEIPIQLPTIFSSSAAGTDTKSDKYTPEYANETTSLEDFEPNFSKPINVVYKDETTKKDFTTGEGEQMTPIETDDVMEENEDAKE